MRNNSFNIKRFCLTVRCEAVSARRTTLSWLAFMSLIYMGCLVFKVYVTDSDYIPGIRNVMMIAFSVERAYTAFHGFSSKDFCQEYLMLPASNLEKYIARILPYFVITLVLPDLSTFVALMLGSVMGIFDPAIMKEVTRGFSVEFNYSNLFYIVGVFALLWLHSIIYACCLFNLRHNKMYSFLIALCIVVMIPILTGFVFATLGIHAGKRHLVVFGIIFVLWTIANFIYSYRAFLKIQIANTNPKT